MTDELPPLLPPEPQSAAQEATPALQPQLLPPQLPELPPGPAPLKARVRQWLRDLWRYSSTRAPPPPRGNTLDRAVYGAAQPLLGLRVVFSSLVIFREAIEPVLWLAVVCALAAYVRTDTDDVVKAGHSLSLELAISFYKTFALLAPFPSVIFANHYARFAARVRFHLGFGVCGPRVMPITVSLRRLIQQSILVAITLAPFVFLSHIVPFFGEHLGDALLALWGLNWVVLEAFDDANVLQPGQTLADVEREAEHLRRPWFVRIFRWIERQVPARFARVRRWTHRFGSLVDWLSKPWREESALLEASPRLGAGFALSTAALLATPVLNLLFRPVIIAGATHLLGHIEQEEHAESPEILHEHAPPEEGEAKEAPLGQRFPNLGRRFDRD